MKDIDNNSYPDISVDDFLKMIRTDEWEDRDGNTPLTERIRTLNEGDTSYRDQESILIENLLLKYSENIDAIAATRLIWYLSEIKHNRTLLFDMLSICILNELIPVNGRAVFSLYLLENYGQDFDVFIKVHNAVWERLLSEINNIDPLQFFRIYTYVDRNQVSSLFLHLLDKPEYQDKLTDTLIEWLHDNRLADSNFKTWLVQLVQSTYQKVNSFNKKALKYELKMINKPMVDAVESMLFIHQGAFFDQMNLIQQNRRSQITRAA